MESILGKIPDFNLWPQCTYIDLNLHKKMHTYTFIPNTTLHN